MTISSSLVVLVPSLHVRQTFTQSLTGLCCANDIADVLWVTDLDRGSARNHLARQFLATSATHALWLDDDMAFQPDLANRLLAHQQEVVTALYFSRYPPYYPAAYLKSPGGTKYTFNPLRQWTGGLEKIDACGFGAILTHRRVFERMSPPWFSLKEDEHGEDMYFCALCADHGIPIFLDSSVEAGHIAPERPITKADYFQLNSLNLHSFIGV
jgi:hypothetical protein